MILVIIIIAIAILLDIEDNFRTGHHHDGVRGEKYKGRSSKDVSW